MNRHFALGVVPGFFLRGAREDVSLVSGIFHTRTQVITLLVKRVGRALLSSRDARQMLGQLFRKQIIHAITPRNFLGNVLMCLRRGRLARRLFRAFLPLARASKQIAVELITEHVDAAGTEHCATVGKLTIICSSRLNLIGVKHD